MSSRWQWALRVLVVALVSAGLAVGAVMVTDSDDGDGAAGEGSTPRSGGTLRVALSDLRTLDPARAVHPVEVMTVDHLFDTLVTYDPETLEVAPGIAASWEASFDQRRFTFRLRDDVRFHDGSPVTAADVKATLERVASSAVESPAAFLLDTVTGYTALHDEGIVEELEGVEVVDERTVAIELEQPFADFPAVLGNPRLGIVPAGVGDGELGDDLVGSGPLMLVERSESTIRLERFGDHRPQPSWVDAVEIEVVETVEAAYGRLGDGEADIAPVPADRVSEAAAEYGDAGLGPFLGVLFYGMNLDLPEFGDVRARAALLHAVDTGRIIDVAYGGTIEPTTGLVPPQVPGAADDACGERCRHDPDLARELLAEAFPEGNVPTVAIDFDDDGPQQLVASAIKDDLEAVGIPTELRAHEFSAFGRVLVGNDKELFRFGHLADFPAPDAFLSPLFSSDSENNLTLLDDEEIDETLRAARAEPDPGARAERYREAEQMILSRFPVLPIAQFNNRWAAAEGVGGFAVTPMGMFDIAEVFLSRAPGAQV